MKEDASMRGEERNATASLLMLGAVVGYSLMPLIVAWAGENHFAFNSSWRVGAIVGCLSFLFVAYRELLFDEDVWKSIGKRAKNRWMFLWVVAFFDLPVYALSIKFIDVSISTVLFEIRMILIIFIANFIFRDQRRYRKITGRAVALLALAFAGVYCVISSQTGGWESIGEYSPSKLLWGVSLAFLAAILTAMTSAGFKWGTGLAEDIQSERKQSDLELFGVVVGIVICSLASGIITIPAGFALGEGLSFQTITLGVAGGVTVGTFSAVSWRKANLLIHNLALNAIMYMTPVFSLAWLFAFNLVSVVNPLYLLAGVVMIIAANLGIYLDMNLLNKRESQKSGEADSCRKPSKW